MNVAKASAALAAIMTSVEAKGSKPGTMNKIQLKKDEQIFDALDEQLNNNQTMAIVQDQVPKTPAATNQMLDSDSIADLHS